MLGKRVFRKQSAHLSNEVIDLSGQGSGVYFVEVVNGEKVMHIKVLKE